MSNDFDLTPVDYDPFASDQAPSNPYGFDRELNRRERTATELGYDPDEAAKRMFGAGPGFADRLQARGGNKRGQVEDRRGDRPSGYQAMLAGNQMIRGIARAIVGAQPFSDYPIRYEPQTGPRTKLQRDAGIDDIDR